MARERFEDVVKSPAGDVVASATVLVLEYLTGATATVYSTEAGAAQANPWTTDSSGHFGFWGNDGRYVILINGVVEYRDVILHGDNASSETAVGHIELATSAEVLTGTDTARAIVPANFKAGVEDWIVFARKAAQTDRNTDDTPAADPELTATVGEGTWEFYMHLLVTATINTGFSFLPVHVGAAANSMHRYILWDGTTPRLQGNDNINTQIDYGAAVAALSGDSIRIRGAFTVTSSNTFALWWSQETSHADNASLLASSYMIARRLA